MTQEFTLVSLNISERTGTVKQPVPEILFIEGCGIENDAHAGRIEERQVSLLSMDEIEASSAYAAAMSQGRLLKAGDFAENITTRGVSWHRLPIGTLIYMGDAVLEISQIGKVCHGTGCPIKQLTGECVMPAKGIFARVIRGGRINGGSYCYYSF
jgi:MOSC domain-containing protein YiiM